jgi:hypothetical protein|tara:strand:+ start:1281 stop:1430 length:150 start_codon:yes stop_codon:yes gene_type:complete
MIVLKDIIINYENKTETPKIVDVEISNSKFKIINPIEQIKNPTETFEGN